MKMDKTRIVCFGKEITETRATAMKKCPGFEFW
jgi:hypothetical protein